jgi:hypothetical protein
MTTDKVKGIVGLASDRLRETNGALRGEGPRHSANSEDYHKNRNCQTPTASRPRTSYRGQAASRSARRANGSTARVEPDISTLRLL